MEIQMFTIDANNTARRSAISAAVGRARVAHPLPLHLPLLPYPGSGRRVMFGSGGIEL